MGFRVYLPNHVCTYLLNLRTCLGTHAKMAEAKGPTSQEGGGAQEQLMVQGPKKEGGTKKATRRWCRRWRLLACLLARLLASLLACLLA